jgi:kynurenine formamidase
MTVALGGVLGAVAACTASAPAPVAAQAPGATTAAAGTASAPVFTHVVDLGHALAPTDPTWDGKPVFSYEVLSHIDKDGYFAGRFSTDEHFGTHLDAPAHFAKDGLTVDKIPADRLVRPAVVINVASKVEGHEDYQLTADDVRAFEQGHGRIPGGDIVLVATGWDSRWPDAAKYMNIRRDVKHFPGVSLEAARLLVERHVDAIGIDTGSIDYGPSATFETHQFTMGSGLFHIENATGLTSLPASGFTVVVAPVKVAGGSGAPARVFALVR